MNLTVKICTLVVAIGMLACQEATENPALENASITRNQTLYDKAESDLKNGTSSSDAFNLLDVKIEGTNLLVKVSYSGGCSEHKFNIVWPEVIIQIYPPTISVILNHDNNGDQCEAMITKTLSFDLTDDSLSLSEQEINDMILTVVNGSNAEEKLSNK